MRSRTRLIRDSLHAKYGALIDSAPEYDSLARSAWSACFEKTKQYYTILDL